VGEAGRIAAGLFFAAFFFTRVVGTVAPGGLVWGNNVLGLASWSAAVLGDDRAGACGGAHREGSLG
jgi:hypothetical protein